MRVELAKQALSDVQELYGPIAAEGARMLQTFTAAELSAVLKILDESSKMQRDHAKRIRTMGAKTR